MHMARACIGARFLTSRVSPGVSRGPRANPRAALLVVPQPLALATRPGLGFRLVTLGESSGGLMGALRRPPPGGCLNLENLPGLGPGGFHFSEIAKNNRTKIAPTSDCIDEDSGPWFKSSTEGPGLCQLAGTFRCLHFQHLVWLVGRMGKGAATCSRWASFTKLSAVNYDDRTPGWGFWGGRPGVCRRPIGHSQFYESARVGS
jgi:hypothetical protein